MGSWIIFKFTKKIPNGIHYCYHEIPEEGVVEGRITPIPPRRRAIENNKKPALCKSLFADCTRRVSKFSLGEKAYSEAGASAASAAGASSVSVSGATSSSGASPSNIDTALAARSALASAVSAFSSAIAAAMTSSPLA